MAMFMSMIFRKLEEIDDDDKKKCEEKAAKLKDDPMINFSEYYSISCIDPMPRGSAITPVSSA